jgi:hypothetical protein
MNIKFPGDAKGKLADSFRTFLLETVIQWESSLGGSLKDTLFLLASFSLGIPAL